MIYVPSRDVIIPTHGFSSGLFGRRTRNVCKGGSRGGASLVVRAFLPGIAVFENCWIPASPDSLQKGQARISRLRSYWISIMNVSKDIMASIVSCVELD